MSAKAASRTSDITRELHIALSNEKENRDNFLCKSSFTRDRLLTFKDLSLIIIRNMGKSYQRELNEFYKAVESDDFLIQKVTKGAFTQARANLSADAFRNLDRVTVDRFYQGDYHGWGRYRVLAIDGSTVQLPRHASVREEFGEHGFGPNADVPRSLARISMLYDVLNCMTLDAQMAPYTTGEIELGNRHLAQVRKGDLVVFDRYYACFATMDELQSKGADFCFRMKDNWFKEVEAFQREGLDDKEVTFHHQGRPIRARLVRVRLSATESQVLCTSVQDRDYDLEDFKELYQSRWGIETNYRYLKSWLELENFSGRTALSVRQDFLAKVFVMNLTSALCYPVEERIEREKAGCRLNRVDAISATKHLLVPMFYQKDLERAMASFESILFRARHRIRPNRHHKRKKRQRAKFSAIYKNL